ncbi:hypothetical protein GJW-30_1_02788 [Variibacter gotjawalensis]|uniref:Uncharacterized protein n=1 Tax=Variibacter gotjawalensis TaxID=1333996 RepID=A0A0S3PWG2_9BRAD|nr:hypothetical protein [Variibacter gotjawalensis]NIK46078.1 hypothetical protein [Variibacter gotjawalensis]RZS47996.1 hypothetical protein EV661_0391 [Variibacter gotjawalensis]BAT60252.1 hypothetical protein GJW-30_1_02788 [Variibacter gotjawalensis]
MIANTSDLVVWGFSIATAVMAVLVVPILREQFYRRVRTEGGFLTFPAHRRSIRSGEYVRYQIATFTTLILALATLLLWNIPIIAEVAKAPERVLASAHAACAPSEIVGLASRTLMVGEP